MNLKFVTCSGANEFTNVDALFALYQDFPCVEFGIQVSGKKCGFDSARFAWLKTLKKEISLRNLKLPLALHINQDWVESFCNGEVVAELQELFSWADKHGEPLFQRVQLNFKIGREKAPRVPVLEKTMQNFPYLRFILSYNEANAKIIQKIYQRQKVVFDCLFDESFGEGIKPLMRQKPVFDDILQGYAGGFSPENVASELNVLAALLPHDMQIFIDAEGKLKGEDGHFSYFKAHDFVAHAISFVENNA